ncbi:transposase InsO family protein [Kribbella aluminosa]|uniref:Transposase InsO family protein n=1 Tax=Kribbella aluminosa TaxID=416017 RepID=A0ABS4UIP6_9ACTN|nr:IS3 family transposase [Kribbella aluminosa]MBP2351479.1 transposase InsO family protein [Kribbella aluminosa]
MNCYPFIEAEKAGDHNVKRACELLQVSRSAYYADRTSGPSLREQRDAELTGKIVEIHDDSRHTYGSPRVHRELKAQGERCSRKRVARLMRAADRYGRTPRRWKKTTIADPAAATRPDLIGRDFDIDPDHPGQLDRRWCGDITYIHTWQGWLYLATVIDLASRRVVGWAVADHLRTDLVADALTDAVNRRRPAAGVVFHSDRGCQYTSAQFANLARDLCVTLSVGRKGQCWDNAVAESFFATVKTELIHRRAWPTRKAASSALFDYIEGWYNTRRRHSTLGYLSPTQYESSLTVTAEQVA